MIGISTACGIATAPILWLQFGTIPLWTVPANALAEPAMPVLLGCGLAAAALAPVLPSAAVALSWLAGAAAAWIAFSARLIASLPHAQTSSRTLVLSLAGAVVCASGLKLLPRYRRQAVVITVAVVVPLLVVGWWAVHPPAVWSPPPGLRVTFLDVGQGDGILLETPQGAMLVDAGPPEAHVDRQLRAAGAALARRSRGHAPASRPCRRRYRLSSARSRSVGCSTRCSPGRGSTSGRCATTARRLRRAARSLPASGRRTRSDACDSECCGPTTPARRGEDPHLHGTVLLATYGSIDLLLTGDSESAVTRQLPLRPVEVLKVAHHGSSDPGLADELAVLRPRVAVISVGAHNDYGHPRADTLAALKRRPGLTVFRTDQNGRIVLESDGRSLTVRTERGVR